MIVIEVFAPIIGKKYDFRIDENASVSDLKEEICVMICQKEQYPLIDNMSGLMLVSTDRMSILKDELSCAENGIMNSERLIII